MIKKIHVNYIPSFYKRPESNSSAVGDLAHPLYVFIQLFVFYQNPCSILHNFPVKKTCAFSVPLICSSVCGQMCSHVCVYDHKGLYWLAFCATSCTFCLPWVHFECSLCTFLHSSKVHFCAHCSSSLWICRYCAFLHILWPICNSLCISPMAVDTVYSLASCQRRSQGPFLELGAA